MKKGYFITGTDTDVGKTWATVALMRFFKNHGSSVVGMKPVAAGCEWVEGTLKNEDALLLQENASVLLTYKEINPYAFKRPVSPHLAAENTAVDITVLLQAFQQIKNKADIVMVEGAGGWFAPISDEYDIVDLAKAMQLPVIMVVAIRLGCINHARLTHQAIKSAGINCAGWLAMCVDKDMMMQTENIETIKSKLSSPLLGILPYSPDADFNDLANHIMERHLI